VPFTTRVPKEGELDGVHYHFVSRETFKEMQQVGLRLGRPETLSLMCFSLGAFWGWGKEMMSKSVESHRLNAKFLCTVLVRSSCTTMRKTTHILILLPPPFPRLLSPCCLRASLSAALLVFGGCLKALVPCACAFAAV
jgi:hypothetical protein